VGHLGSASGVASCMCLQQRRHGRSYRARNTVGMKHRGPRGHCQHRSSVFCFHQALAIEAPPQSEVIATSKISEHVTHAA